MPLNLNNGEPNAESKGSLIEAAQISGRSAPRFASAEEMFEALDIQNYLKT